MSAVAPDPLCIKEEMAESTDGIIKSIEKRLCTTKDHLDQALDHPDCALKATAKSTGNADTGLSSENVPMDIDRYVLETLTLATLWVIMILHHLSGDE